MDRNSRGEVGVAAGRLDQAAHLRQHLAPVLADVLPQHADAAAVRRGQAGKQADGGGLAMPVVAEEGEHAALGDHQLQVLQYPPWAVGLVDGLQFDRCVWHGGVGSWLPAASRGPAHAGVGALAASMPSGRKRGKPNQRQGLRAKRGGAGGRPGRGVCYHSRPVTPYTRPRVPGAAMAPDPPGAWRSGTGPQARVRAAGPVQDSR